MMKYLITGCAGFIGSNLVDELLRDGHQVVGVDNLTTGQPRFLANASQRQNFNMFDRDLTEFGVIDDLLHDVDWVVHLAANADVRFGLNHPEVDLKQNTLATFNVLEAMRKRGVKKIAFSSTGSVYGEAEVIPTPEAAPFPIQTSLYGASKLACEGLISAYCEGYGFTGVIFRFVSILGERYSHGHVYDFVRQLLQCSDKLEILGDGKQTKSYLYVGDCINAIKTVLQDASEGVQIYNLGRNDTCEVTQSAAWIADEMGQAPVFNYTGGARGWIGDNPLILLDTAKIERLGWSPKVSIEEGVRRTVKYLQNNQWLFEKK